MYVIIRKHGTPTLAAYRLQSLACILDIISMHHHHQLIFRNKTNKTIIK